MLTDDECDKVFAAWCAMTPREQAQVNCELELLRIDASLHDRFNLKEIEGWRVSSKDICADMASNGWPGAAPAIELETLKRLMGPKVAAWERVAECFLNAMRDKAIKANPDAMEMLVFALHISSECCDTNGSLGEYMDRWIDEVSIKIASSRKARNAALSKNAEPRKWALSEWENRADKGQGKAAFARQYSLLVKKRFDLTVNPETIARDWLPKSQ